MSASMPWSCLRVVSMKRSPRPWWPSRCERGEEYARLGPRGSEAVRVVARRGSSLLEPNLVGLVFVGLGFERSVLSDLVLSDLDVSDLARLGLERSRRSGRDG